MTTEILDLDPIGVLIGLLTDASMHRSKAGVKIYFKPQCKTADP